MISSLVHGVVVFLAGGVSTAVLLILWLSSNAGNLDRIVAALGLVLGRFSTRWEHRSLRADITARINDFTSRMRDSIHGLEPVGLDIRFVDERMTPEAFMNQGRLVVRLRPRHEQDHNFLTVASLYVSAVLFPRVKNQLRPNLRKALDLYTTEKLIRTERSNLVDEFIDRWVNPALNEHEKLEPLLQRLCLIDEHGYYLSVLCQELHILSTRLIGTTNREALRSDIELFIAFLERLTSRRTGQEDIPLRFTGQHLRMVFQIVSRSHVREANPGSTRPWLDYALETHPGSLTDHVYFLGSAEDANRALIDNVADAFCRGAAWDVYCRTSYQGRVIRKDGTAHASPTYVVLCRRRGRPGLRDLARPNEAA